MPGIIDPETVYVDDLPTIWSPAQEELTEGERLQEINLQATASLLWAADAPEAVLRLLLGETEIERVFEPPAGYDPEQQGDWNEGFLTFAFKHPIRLKSVKRQADSLEVVYNLEGAGYWRIEITPESVSIDRI
jgi:hypothetical protein